MRTAISGSSAEMGTMPATRREFSTTFGNSPLPLVFGRGWAATARFPQMCMDGRAYMARWERPQPEICPAPARERRPGVIRRAISGSSAVMVSMKGGMAWISMVFGGSTFLQRCGRGWVEGRLQQAAPPSWESKPAQDNPAFTERFRALASALPVFRQLDGEWIAEPWPTFRYLYVLPRRAAFSRYLMKIARLGFYLTLNRDPPPEVKPFEEF